MANALEEVRNLMPGKGHANWSLSEDVKAKAVSFVNKSLKKLGFEAKAGTMGESGNIGVYKRGENHPVATFAASRYGLMVAMAPPGHTEFRKLSDAMQKAASSFKESVAGAPGAFATGEPIEEAKMSPAARWKKLLADFDETQDYATAKKLMTQIKRMTAKMAAEDPLRKGMRHYVNAETHRHSKLRKLKAKAESIAGAPGPFAISDAEPRYVDDQMADLLDRVRNPRWEYPSWALPKVKLDEAKFEAAIYDKAKGEKVEVVLDVAKDGTVKAEGRVVGRVAKDPGQQGRWFGETAKGRVVSERHSKKSVLRDIAAHSIGVRLLGMPKVKLDEAGRPPMKMSKWDMAALKKNVRRPNDVFSKALKIAKSDKPVPWKTLYAVLNHLKKRRTWDERTPSSEYRDEEGLIGKLEKNMGSY